MSEEKDGVVTHSISFTLKGDEVRHTNDAGVTAYDDALARVGSGEVMHFMDPRRVQMFAAGGPPVWSVATVPVGGDTLYLTYGFAGAIDPARAEVDFELSIRVRGPSAMWPALFLRGLCRYMLGSGRMLEEGQFMPFPGALTRFSVTPAEAQQMPDTGMRAACFVADPTLPVITTPAGPVRVRRVVGLYLDEVEAMELWSVAGFASVLAGRDGTLTTDIARSSLAGDPQVQAAILEGSRREGSNVAFVAVPGVQWEPAGEGAVVRFPGGAHATRIHRMLQARLPFGRHLLVHDVDPGNQLAVAFVPSDTVQLSADGAVLVMNLPATHDLLASFAGAPEEGLTWQLG